MASRLMPLMAATARQNVFACISVFSVIAAGASRSAVLAASVRAARCSRLYRRSEQIWPREVYPRAAENGPRFTVLERAVERAWLLSPTSTSPTPLPWRARWNVHGCLVPRARTQPHCHGSRGGTCMAA